MLGDIQPPPGDPWSTWIIGTILTVLGTVTATVVTLAKYIEGKYRAEVADLKTEQSVLKKHVDDCEKDRTELRVQLATVTTEQKAQKANQEKLEQRLAAIEKTKD